MATFIFDCSDTTEREQCPNSVTNLHLGSSCVSERLGWTKIYIVSLFTLNRVSIPSRTSYLLRVNSTAGNACRRRRQRRDIEFSFSTSVKGKNTRYSADLVTEKGSTCESLQKMCFHLALVSLSRKLTASTKAGRAVRRVYAKVLQNGVGRWKLK
jgi:hypothetical protein